MGDPRARVIMGRYLATLQAIQALGMKRFAEMLDTAEFAQVEDHVFLLDFLEKELARAAQFPP